MTVFYRTDGVARIFFYDLFTYHRGHGNRTHARRVAPSQGPFIQEAATDLATAATELKFDAV